MTRDLCDVCERPKSDWCAAHAPSRADTWAVQDREIARRKDLDALLPDLIAALGDHPLAQRLRKLLP